MPNDPTGIRHVTRTLGSDVLRQVDPFDVFHHQKVQPAHVPRIHGSDDMRVFEPTDSPYLPFKAS